MAKKGLGDMVPDIKKAMDKGFRDFIIDTQSELGEANPKDTGRMSSSWWIAQNQQNRSTRPEDWGESGEKKYEAPKYSGKITADGTWFISNSVPYAERVALDPQYSGGGDGGSAWYTSIASQLQRKANETMDYYLRKL